MVLSLTFHEKCLVLYLTFHEKTVKVSLTFREIVIFAIKIECIMKNVYYPRLIDKYLLEWKNERKHKPLLLRGARQVGKSSAIRQLGILLK